MSVKDILIKSYTDREDKVITLGAQGDKSPVQTFETRLIGQSDSINFKISRKSENVFVGLYSSNDLKIKKTFIIDPKKYTIEAETQITDISDNFKGISFFMVERLEEGADQGSFLMPQFGRQEAYVSYEDTDGRVPLAGEEALAQDEKYYKQVNLAALSSHYFSMAFIDRSPILPDLNLEKNRVSKNIIARVNYKPVNYLKSLEIKNTFFIGPKSVSLLESVDSNLAQVIDFGMFHSLAVPMLKLMNWFYDLFGNYGLAIILLTLTVRTIVLPFTVMSYRSMKTMQVIQPQIKSLREKYKDNPQKLNQEMMVLMRENKANPMGGCLPMLLQFPVFIALYQVFGQSIGLYKAPFAFWITDLSLSDPYFVIPVLMGLTMFVQQKITPTSVDPAQAKILMFMPIMFTAFMLFLPSALTLYMFISTLYGILQQMFFMRDKNKVATTVNA